MITCHCFKTHTPNPWIPLQVLMNLTEDPWTLRIGLWTRAFLIPYLLQMIHNVAISYFALCGSSACAALSFPYVLASLRDLCPCGSPRSYCSPGTTYESANDADLRSHDFGSVLMLVPLSSALSLLGIPPQRRSLTCEKEWSRQC